MKKFVALTLVIIIMVVSLASCELSGSAQDTMNQIESANDLQRHQPTPTDIDYSLERYNLIRRTYWVNGQREKANSLPCQVEKPLGYIVLFAESGAVVSSFIVDGKVSSLNSFLTPDSEYYEKGSINNWLADVDGTYGTNDNGIFFFTPEGNYYEWTGTYLYSDVPMIIEDPVIKVGK